MQKQSRVVRVLERFGVVDTGPRYVLLADQRSIAICERDSVRVMGGAQDYSLTLRHDAGAGVSVLRTEGDGERVVATYAAIRPARKALGRIVRAASPARPRRGWLLAAVVVAVFVFANPFARLRAPAVPDAVASSPSAPAWPAKPPALSGKPPALAVLPGTVIDDAADDELELSDCGF